MAWPVGIPSRGSMAETRRRAPPNSRCGDGHAHAIAVAGYIRQQLKGTVKKKSKRRRIVEGLTGVTSGGHPDCCCQKNEGRVRKGKEMIEDEAKEGWDLFEIVDEHETE